MATRNTHGFFVTGTAEINQITGLKRTGQFAEQLVPRDKIVFLPLYMKLGLMKKIVKTLDKDGDLFQYI